MILCHHTAHTNHRQQFVWGCSCPCSSSHAHAAPERTRIRFLRFPFSFSSPRRVGQFLAPWVVDIPRLRLGHLGAMRLPLVHKRAGHRARTRCMVGIIGWPTGAYTVKGRCYIHNMMTRGKHWSQKQILKNLDESLQVVSANTDSTASPVCVTS